MGCHCNPPPFLFLHPFLSFFPVALGRAHLKEILHLLCQIFSDRKVVIIYTAFLDKLLRETFGSSGNVSQNMYLLQLWEVEKPLAD